MQFIQIFSVFFYVLLLKYFENKFICLTELSSI